LRQLEGRSDDGAFQTKGLPSKAKAAEPGTPGGYNTGADVVMSDKKKRKADADPETPASGKKEKKVRSPFAVAPCAFYPPSLVHPPPHVHPPTHSPGEEGKERQEIREEGEEGEEVEKRRLGSEPCNMKRPRDDAYKLVTARDTTR
jgi:hypothetical protein